MKIFFPISTVILIFPALLMGAERVAYFVIPEDKELLTTAQEIEYYLRKQIEKRMYTPAEISSRELAVFEDEIGRQNEEAKKLILEGKKLYEEFKLDQCFFVFQKIISNLEKGSAAFEKSGDYQLALMFMGNIYQLKGDYQLARETFIRLLVYNIKYTPDANYFPPDIIETFEKARTDVKSLKNGTLMISPKPEDTQIFVDGVFIGSGTIKIEGITAGEHLVGIRKRGYLPYIRKVVIQPELMEMVTTSMVGFSEVSERYREILMLKEADISMELPAPLRKYIKDSNADILTILFISGNKDRITLNGYTYYKERPVVYKKTSISLLNEESRKKVIRNGITDFSKYILPDDISSLKPISVISHKKFYNSWWFYSILGVAFIGAATAGYLLFSGEEKENNNGALIISF
ncbi:MAG: PEGA domain-containing protein [Myxococcota bacterium]